MPASIVSIGTALPSTVVSQDAFRDVYLADAQNSALVRRLVPAAFDSAMIRTRHLVVPDFADTPPSERIFHSPAVGLLEPGTAARGKLYRECAPVLAADAGRDAFAGVDVTPDQVTHLVTVSCTGFYAPGPDVDLIVALGLSRAVHRTHIGFMGCYAALPGLRTGFDIVQGAADAVVLVVCVELCSLHMRPLRTPDDVLAASLFADGAAAAIITANPSTMSPRLQLESFHSVLLPEGANDMGWTIGDTGFEMILTGAVPRVIGRHAVDAVNAATGPLGLRPGDIDLWAVHPGGRAILDRFEAALALPADALAPSRAVLGEYGNMSSATILFVLRDLLRAAGPSPSRVLALAFGPGLTVESAILTRTSGTVQ